MAPNWCQDGPKRAQKDSQKTTKTRKLKRWGPKRRHPRFGVTSWGPSWTPSWPILDKFWRLFVNMFAKRFLHRFLIVFWGGLRTFIFWFSLKRKHNYGIFVKVLVGIVFDPQTPPKINEQLCQNQYPFITFFSLILQWFLEIFLSDSHWISLCEVNAATYDLLENSRVDQGSALSEFIKKWFKN